MKLEGTAPCVSPPSLFKVGFWPISSQQTFALPVYPFIVPKNSHIIGAVPHEKFGHCQMMVMMTNDGHDDNDGTCVLTEYLWFSAPPPLKKTQTQKKTYVDQSWGGQIVNYVSSVHF